MSERQTVLVDVKIVRRVANKSVLTR